MKRLLLITAIVCLFGYIATGPFLTLQGIKNGIESADMESLSDNVDFPVLRQNLKDQLNAQLSSTLTEDSDNWGTKLASGFATLFTDKLVDNFVTPAGLSKLLSGKKINKGEIKIVRPSIKNGINSGLFINSDGKGPTIPKINPNPKKLLKCFKRFCWFAKAKLLNPKS